MGGKSQKQTVGHKYHLGGHQVICQGPIDSITAIRVKDLTAWEGNSTGGSIEIDAEHLFGGSKEPTTTPTFSGGDNAEADGISGTVDILMGEKTQSKNSYLMKVLGNLIPAFRGVVSAVLNQCYIGNSEYPDAWSFLGSRIHTKEWGEAQWYDEKAAITFQESGVVGTIDVGDTWEYKVVTQGSDPGNNDLTPPSSGWLEGVMPFGYSYYNTLPTPAATAWPTWSVLWVRYAVNIPAGTTLRLHVVAENGCVIFYNGDEIGSLNRNNDNIVGYSEGDFNFSGGMGSGYIYIKSFDEIVPPQLNSNTYLVVTGTYEKLPLQDMNPAHWLRELYTSKRNAMGHPEGEVNDVALMAVADTLYDEGVGISLLWDQQKSVDEMFDLTLEHIEGVHYVDEAGLLTVKLIRDDYDVDDLFIVDESIVIRVEKYSSTNQLELVNSISGVYDNTLTRKEASVMVADPALVQTQGKIKSATIQLPFFSNPNTTIRRITAELRKKSNSLMAFELVCNRKVAHLNIGDVFILSLPEHNAFNVVMRIFDKKKGNGLNNEVRLVCTQDIYSLPIQAIKVVTPDAWVNPRTPATAVPAQLTFELPYYELVQAQGQTEVDNALSDPTVGALGVAAVRPSGNSINAQIMIDTGAGYRGGDELEFCPTALLATTMDYKTKEIEFTDDIDVDLIQLGSHCQIGDELHVIEELDPDARTATLGRGVLDTVPQPHAIGDRIWFWDFYSASDTQTYLEGQSVDVKVLPNTSSGRLPISAAGEQTFEFAGRAARPYPPGRLRINGLEYPESIGLDDALTVSFAYRDRIQQTAGVLQDTNVGDIGPEPGTTHRLRIFNEFEMLLRTVNMPTGNTYTYPPATEITDSGGSSSGFTVEPYWTATKLLLNFNGTNGGTNFVDSSGNYASVAGNAQISTAQSKFGGAAALFDGTGDYLSFPDSNDWSFGTGDATLEAFIYPVSFPGTGMEILAQRNTADNNNFFFFRVTSAGKIRLYAVSGGTTITDISSNGTVSLNTWSHVAACRVSGTWKIWINGSNSDTVTTNSTSAWPNVAYPLLIGAGDNVGNFFNGYIDSLRATKGGARYTSTFTPTTSEFAKYVKDANFSDNKLVLNFEGDNHSKAVADGSDLALAAVAYGNAEISTTQAKFGSTSLSLDGDYGSFVDVPFHISQAGSGVNLTVECFAYTPDVARAGTLASRETSSTSGGRAGWMFGLTNTGKPFAQGWTDSGATAFTIVSASSISANTWYHYALVRNGTTWTLYINGSSVGNATETDVLGVGGQNLQIGNSPWTSIKWLGFIDDFRLRAQAAYTTTFTPPTTSAYPIDSFWSNNVLLLNCNGANTSVLFENIAPVTKLMTVAGNAQISTAQSKYGGASGYFDGAGDYITCASSASLDFGTGDYTIELWVNVSAVGSIMTLFSRYQSWPGTVQFYCHMTAAGKIQYRAGNSLPISLISTTSIVANTWNHIAISCAGGTTRLFLNGALEASTSTTASLSSTQPLGIGYELTGGVYYFSGYMDDMRITKGVARYTSAFTPPATELSQYLPVSGDLNEVLIIELESIRDELTSYQKHRFTVNRAA